MPCQWVRTLQWLPRSSPSFFASLLDTLQATSTHSGYTSVGDDVSGDGPRAEARGKVLGLLDGARLKVRRGSSESSCGEQSEESEKLHDEEGG